MTKEELSNIIENHKHWITKDCDGWKNMCAKLRGADLYGFYLSGVDLRNADLTGVDLCGADLSGANLCHTNLSYANLRSANLCGVDLSYSNLSCADLRHADLRSANLCDANLYGVNLSGADLRNADLTGANLRSANLCDANLSGAEGSLIEYRKGKFLTEDIKGYKKCRNEVIVTLLIPRGAIVLSINGNKCRTNRAKVINIEGADRAYSSYDNTSYYVGDEFTIYDFNCEYNVECSKGIHFFMTREEAEKY